MPETNNDKIKTPKGYVRIKGVDVPEQYAKQASIYEEESRLGDEYIKSLEEQEAAVQGGVSALEKEKESGLSNLKRQAAQSLLGARSQLGGGRTLAGLRGTSTEAATKAALLAGQYEKNIAAEKQKAAAAKSEVLAEKAKMTKKLSLETTHTNNQIAKAKGIVEEEKGTIYTTDEDKKRMAERIRKELLSGESNPSTIRELESFIATLQSSSYDTKGSLDV